MKIAVCFSGQIRTGVEASENIKRFLGDLLPYCDFFIHTWNINSYKTYCNTRIKRDDEILSNETINKIVDIYKPKDIEVEDHYTLAKDNTNLYGSNFSLWYSFYRSVQLKKQYEKDNNFEYDFVVKLRFDIIFSPYRKLVDDYLLLDDNSIYIENFVICENETKEDLKFIDDVYYLGKSRVIDIISDYYCYDIYLRTGYFLLKYLEYFNIKYDVNLNKDYNLYKETHSYVIYRHECLKYSPITEYYKCMNCDLYYFSNIEPYSYTFSGGYALELNRKYIKDDLFEPGNISYISELKEREGYEDRSMF